MSRISSLKMTLSRLWKGRLTIMLVPHSPESVFTIRLPYWAFTSLILLFLSLGISSLFLTPSINRKISYYEYTQNNTSDFQSQIQKANKYIPNIASSQEKIYTQLMSVFAGMGISEYEYSENMAKGLANGDNTLFLEYLENKVKNINMYVNNFKSFFKAIPAVLPTNTHFYISSPFGWRIHPIKKKRYFHSGVDLAIMPGTPVLSTGDGVALEAGSRGGYGTAVYIKHNEGYESRYGHLMRLASSLYVGSKVKRGQIIGYVGNTGVSTGYHLHYEVRVNGEAVEPTRFFYLDKFKV